MNDIYDVLNSPEKEDYKKESKPFDKQAWSEKKQAEIQGAYELIDTTAAQLGSDISKLVEYLDVQSRMDKYSVGNALLILAQKPDATQLKDYDGWKEAGTGVKPKEKGIIILEPGNEYVREDGTTAVSYNAKRVFDVSQTFTREKSKPQVNRDERFILKALVQNASVPIKAVDSFDPPTMGAAYDDKEKVIIVRRGLNNTDFFLAVSQELAHAEFAKGGNYNRAEQGYKAYFASYMLCKRYGIDTKAFSFKQIPEALAIKDASEIRNTLSEIRSAINEINDGMSKAFSQSKSPALKEQER